MSVSEGRLWLFRLLALALPLAFLVLAEVTLRLLAPVDDPFIHVQNETTIFERTKIDGVEYLEVIHPEAYAARGTKFAIEKPAGTLRVFSIGGSASAGWPHPGDEIYTEYLAQALSRTYPEQQVEVVNLGAHGFASYRVRMVFDDVKDYDPDLLIVFSGNNDFLEARSYFVEAGWRRWLENIAQHSHLVGALGEFGGLRAHEGNTIDGSSARGHHAAAVWGWVKQVSLDLRRDPEEFEAVKRHYAHTMEHIAEEAGERGIPVLLMTVPVNLRDWKPNSSYNRLEAEQLEAWQEHYRAARRALLEGNASQALTQLDAAISLEPVHAESYFHRARAFEAQGEFDRAREDYVFAKDLDHNPFRTISAFNESLRRIASERDGVHLADAERAFFEASDDPAPGFELFLDYVHPTKRGNLLIAQTLFEAIVQESILAIEPAVTQFIPDEDSGYREGDNMAIQMVLLWILGMNRQDESMVAKADALMAFIERLDPATRKRETLRLEAFIRDIRATVAKNIALQRRKLLGEEITPDEHAAVEAQLQVFFDKYYMEKGRPWNQSVATQER